MQVQLSISVTVDNERNLSMHDAYRLLARSGKRR